MLELNLWTITLSFYASAIGCITMPNCQLTFNMVSESKPNNQSTNEWTNQSTIVEGKKSKVKFDQYIVFAC